MSKNIRLCIHKLGIWGSGLFFLILLNSCGVQIDDISDNNYTPERKIHVLGSTDTLVSLTKDYCELHPEIKVEIEDMNQSDLSEELSILAASNDLPDLFLETKPQSLINGNLVVCIDDFLKDNQMEDLITDKVREGLIQIYEDDSEDSLYILPTEQNIEGFWYNVRMFKEHGWKVPETMDDFIELCEQITDDGIQPIAVAGREGFYLSRLWGAYVTSELGTDALKQANSGIISWTDEAFLKAYEWVQFMADEGYFGNEIVNVSEEEMNHQFINGKVAIVYSGSWIVRTLNTSRLIHDGDIGFFGFPEVENGLGKQENYCQNYGIGWMIGAKNYDEILNDYLVFIFSNYGDRAMEIQGLISGYELKEQHKSPYYTKMVESLLDTAESPSLWPEYAMSSEQQNISYESVKKLVLGEISPKQYGEILENSRISQ